VTISNRVIALGLSKIQGFYLVNTLATIFVIAIMIKHRYNVRDRIKLLEEFNNEQSWDYLVHNFIIKHCSTCTG